MNDNKLDKFPDELRTFETRLQFISEIFENKFSQVDILAHCVVHKLDRSYLIYNEQLAKSMLNLTGRDPLSVLKKIK